MPKYRFTGAHPLILSTVSHGADVHIEREFTPGEVDGPLPVAPADGSTVVIEPGDIITLPDELAVYGLELVDEEEPEKAPEKAPEQKAPVTAPAPAKAPTPAPAAETQAEPAPIAAPAASAPAPTTTAPTTAE